MAIKLIALDLDGTLLTSQKTIDEQTKQKLKQAMDAGISIVIATGRDKGGINFVSEPLELATRGKNFVAGVNGQIIYDFYHKEYYVDKVFDGKDAKKVMHLAKKMNFECICCCGYDHFDFIRPSLKFMKKMHSILKGKPMDYGFNQGKRRFITIHDADYEITSDVNKFVLIQTASYFEKNLPKIREELKDFEILAVGPAWIEIMPKGVSKGNALLKIGKENGILPEEMMAFGDAENDMSMFQAVKYGIAMGNAMDSLKQIAYDVTDTNERAGIAKTLDQYIFKKEDA